MDVLQWVKDALAVIQEIEPGVKSAAEVGTVLGTVGTAVVKVVQKGRQLVTYLITKSKPSPGKKEPDTGAPPEKTDVALLIDINRRMLHDVARYLEQQKIDADVLVVTNDPDYSDTIRFLDPDNPDEWVELVKEFNATISKVKHTIGSARVHIFMSTPLPLAFGLGCVWGTVDEATVYHWENGTYHPAMKVSRALRQAGR